MNPLRSRIRWLVLALAAVAATLVSLPGVSEEAPRPHIVLVVVDDLGWADVGFHGGGTDTPNLDALAKSGVELQQFYAQSFGSQTRAALMTGRYPFRYGLQQGQLSVEVPVGLPTAERTLAQALAGAGYATHLVGKWHLGLHAPEYLPLARGFSHHYGSYAGDIDHYTHTHRYIFDWHRDGKAAFDEGHTTDLIAAEAVRVIQAHDAAAPLFLEIAFHAPRAPLQAPRALAQKTLDEPNPKRRAYRALLMGVDAAVGQVLAALDAKGMREGTVVVFLSDNGGDVTSGGASNAPFRGGKGRAGDVYDGAMRVPAVISWPSRLAAGALAEPAHVVDLFPTLAGLAGDRGAGAGPLDGIDLWPYLANKTPLPARELPLMSSTGRFVLRKGQWKLIATQAPGEDGQLSAQLALFDLTADPGEERDLSVERPDVAAELLSSIKTWQAQAAPVPQELLDSMQSSGAGPPDRLSPPSGDVPPVLGEVRP